MAFDATIIALHFIVKFAFICKVNFTTTPVAKIWICTQISTMTYFILLVILLYCYSYFDHSFFIFQKFLFCRNRICTFINFSLSSRITWVSFSHSSIVKETSKVFLKSSLAVSSSLDWILLLLRPKTNWFLRAFVRWAPNSHYFANLFRAEAKSCIDSPCFCVLELNLKFSAITSKPGEYYFSNLSLRAS